MMRSLRTQDSAGFRPTGVILAGMCIFITSPIFGQGAFSEGQSLAAVKTQSAASPQPKYGTQDQIVYTVPAYDFQAIDGSQISNFDYNRYSATSMEMEAPVQLPAGALIKAIGLQGCDADTLAAIQIWLHEVDPDGSSNVLSGTFSTGVTQTPGCNYFSLPLNPPHTVDNRDNVYYVAIAGTSSAATVSAVRVYYRLQISPAPATATFFDVPVSHPFFKSVEALAAAGISGGCGAGSYCPDAPVTREQMAAFLARALGLHWP